MRIFDDLNLWFFEGESPPSSAVRGKLRAPKLIFSSKLVKRYRELKEQATECLLLIQVGAFMDVMGEDARAVSAVISLKLQMAGEVDDPDVLSDFPKTSLDAYRANLFVLDTQ
jgi:hypothetical protein